MYLLMECFVTSLLFWAHGGKKLLSMYVREGGGIISSGCDFSYSHQLNLREWEKREWNRERAIWLANWQ